MTQGAEAEADADAVSIPDWVPVGSDVGADALSLGAETGFVREAVRDLSPRQRDALYLRYYLGFDYTAIAQTLGIQVGTVSATLHAARASLAESLQEVAR